MLFFLLYQLKTYSFCGKILAKGDYCAKETSRQKQNIVYGSVDCCLLPSNVRWGYPVGPCWRAKIHHLANSGGAVSCAIVLC